MKMHESYSEAPNFIIRPSEHTNYISLHPQISF